MRNIKLTIQYDGTDFNGWQVQPKKRTVQGEIESALKKIFKQKIRLIGSGRTDTGVHATGQVANFPVESKLTVSKIQSAINNNTDEDIVISSCEEVTEDFHSQYSTKTKTYCYWIQNSNTPNPLIRNNCLLFPYKLSLAKMRRSAKDLIGTQDFKSFQGNNRSNKDQNTVRTIKKISIKKDGEFLTIEVTGTGFLYKMVRNIVGTLLSIGSGQLEEGSIKKILKARNRQLAPKTAPAHGLILTKVIY